MENYYLDQFKKAIIQISYFMIYLGLISVLMSSVTWKWKRVKNQKNNQHEFVERSQETPEKEFERRRLFALGVFVSIYGAAIQAFLSFMP